MASLSLRLEGEEISKYLCLCPPTMYHAYKYARVTQGSEYA